MAEQVCKCGAEESVMSPGWLCGTWVNTDGSLVVSSLCKQRQGANDTMRFESLNEFHYNTCAIYHAWSTGETDATAAMTEIAKLILAIP